MKKTNVSLRLQASLLAEKLSALRTESYFAERAARADLPRALALLRRSDADAKPAPGDELAN